MSYIIRTRCPNGCKFKSGYTCVAGECPYQTGDVRYDIRLNAKDKPTEINAQVKQAVKEFARKLWDKIKDEGIDYKIGLRALGEEIDELLKEYEE